MYLLGCSNIFSYFDIIVRLKINRMISAQFDPIPVQRLLNKHTVHLSPYEQEFRSLKLVIFPQVFNPAYTQVSGFLADNLIVNPNSRVLDMFCGSGALGFLAIKKVQRVRVTGVDISPYAIKCAISNAKNLGLDKKTEFRQGNLWEAVEEDEQFDLIIANPPLLPAKPENWLEMAIADSPNMSTTIKFLQGCASHLSKNGKVLMTFSNACKVSFKNPLQFVKKTAQRANLSIEITAERHAGYEIYRVLTFRKDHSWQK